MHGAVQADRQHTRAPLQLQVAGPARGREQSEKLLPPWLWLQEGLYSESQKLTQYSR